MSSKKSLTAAIVVLLLMSTIGSLILLGDGSELCYSRDGTAIQTHDVDGSEEVIENWKDLHEIRDDSQGEYVLGRDLTEDVEYYDTYASEEANDGEGWRPIGLGEEEIFQGRLDGGGFTIEGLYIDRELFRVGLFNEIGEGGEVVDIEIVDAEVSGYVLTGTIAGINSGRIENTSVNSRVVGNLNLGGLVGNNTGIVKGSYHEGTVIGSSTIIGGLVGINYHGKISECYSNGRTHGSGSTGGLLGVNEEGYVKRSYAVGDTSGEYIFAGLVGSNRGNISDSYAIGSVTGQARLGIFFDEDTAGGLVGNHHRGSIKDCYAVAEVEAEKNIGGLIARRKNGAEVSSSFWDTDISETTHSEGGIGLSTDDMKDLTVLTDEGWDIATVDNTSDRNTDHTWNIVEDETYPFFVWQEEIVEYEWQGSFFERFGLYILIGIVVFIISIVIVIFIIKRSTSDEDKRIPLYEKKHINNMITPPPPDDDPTDDDLPPPPPDDDPADEDLPPPPDT